MIMKLKNQRPGPKGAVETVKQISSIVCIPVKVNRHFRETPSFFRKKLKSKVTEFMSSAFYTVSLFLSLPVQLYNPFPRAAAAVDSFKEKHRASRARFMNYSIGSTLTGLIQDLLPRSASCRPTYV
jgi:hypothetical protein